MKLINIILPLKLDLPWESLKNGQTRENKTMKQNQMKINGKRFVINSGPSIFALKRSEIARS